MRDIHNLTVAVVGATGVVGGEMVSILEQRGFSLGKLRLFASSNSAGTHCEFDGHRVLVEELTTNSFRGVDIALFSAGSSISAEYGCIAAESGAVVIDNSSYFRMESEIALVVPEVNANVVRDLIGDGLPEDGHIIANPNCSTIQLVVALKPILDEVGIKRVVVSTYQSVSGAGKKGMSELWDQTLAVINQGDVSVKSFPHRIAFNCLPHIDSFLEDGYTKEEMKIVNETRKILEMPDLRVSSTAVRVPVFACHGESVNIEMLKPLSAQAARECLRKSPGILVADDPQSEVYPLSSDVVGTDATFVGRIREDSSVENGLNMWIVADNVRKGAALNAVQIAELVVEAWS